MNTSTLTRTSIHRHPLSWPAAASKNILYYWCCLLLNEMYYYLLLFIHMLVVAMVSGGGGFGRCWNKFSMFLSLHLSINPSASPLFFSPSPSYNSSQLLFLLCLFHSKVLSFLMIIFIIANPNKQNKQSERKPLNTFKPDHWETIEKIWHLLMR